MKRLLYIISAFICIACSLEVFPEDDFRGPVLFDSLSEMAPAAYVQSNDLPFAATKALIDVSTVSSMETNVLRIDENIGNSDQGLYTYGSWKDAYLVEANVASPEGQSGLRSMSLNPVQAYSFKVVDEDTTFYHTRMISWYPRTCVMYKNDEDKAPVMRFSDYLTVDPGAYSEQDGKVVLNFKNLDGSKDVMVSNIVEGQHWHTYDQSDNHYTYPFGQNDAKPTYTNYMTYKHYLAAVKLYAYADDSEQVVSMWGAIRKVVVRDQPSQVSVLLPSPGEMTDAAIDTENHVQQNSLDYGTATFSGKTDFPLIKTAMYESETNDSSDQEVAEDSPYLDHTGEVYLGYALIQPYSQDNPNLMLDVHTDAGVLSLSVPMKQTITQKVDDQDVTYDVTIQPGFIYHIRVNFNTEGAIADIVMQSGEEHYYDLSAHKELSDDVSDYQYANCYIINPEIKRETGDYYDGYAFLATTIGSPTAVLHPEFASDRTTKTIDPVRAGLLWESSQGLITQVEYLYGYIRFKTPPPTSPNYKEGNAVIAAYDSQRKVLWSWHIWITDMPQDVEYTVGSNSFILLDRNLGATAAAVPEDFSASQLLETYGLYYQWGRKDPSMGPREAYYRPQSTATADYYDYYGMTWNYTGVVTLDRPGIRDGVENPMYLILPTDFSMTTYQYDWMYTSVDNLWGDYKEKTIYDPCPFDYMVPQDEISTLFASTTPNHIEKAGMSINGSFFPFAGYKGVDKGVSSLSGAWKYVGEKGDYMSAKIEVNGHRSRTYISEIDFWVEYGADADNDGDGDASRTYESNIIADDMANRRTAASVRCLKIGYGENSGLGSSLRASFVGDRTYAFVGDGQITFDYSVRALGDGVTVNSAKVDLNGADMPDNEGVLPGTPATYIEGTVPYDIPSEVGNGVARYRLIAEASNSVISRVSHSLRLFDISDLMIDNKSYSESLTFNQGTKYPASFILKGIHSDFKVLINGVQADKDKNNITTNSEDLSSIPYSVTGINITGHIHIQITDADGNLACEKSYPVQMNTPSTYVLGDKITNVNQLEGAGLYFIHESSSYYKHYVAHENGYVTLKSYKDAGTLPTITSDMVFAYHRNPALEDGTGSKSVGAWFNPAANGFLKSDFTFGTEQEALYMICSKMQNSLVFLSSETNLYFCFINDPPQSAPAWNSYGFAYHGKWDIYKVTPQ